MADASVMTLVVRKLTGDRAMVEPMSQPPGRRCGIMVWRNWAGEFICSKALNRVMMSAAVDAAGLLLDRGRRRSSIAQFR